MVITSMSYELSYERTSVSCWGWGCICVSHASRLLCLEPFCEVSRHTLLLLCLLLFVVRGQPCAPAVSVHILSNKQVHQYVIPGIALLLSHAYNMKSTKARRVLNIKHQVQSSEHILTPGTYIHT